jgi:glucose-6-phosphate isomerase
MLRIDCSNLEAKAVGDENGLTKSDIDAVAQATPRGHDQIQKWRKSEDAIFYDVVADDSQLAGIAEKASEVAESFDDIVVLGIGGSSLGLRCAAQALLPPFWNLKTRAERKNHPRLFVCDNIDPETISGLFNWLDMKRTCFTVISKSGGTTETASQMLLARERLKGKLGDVWKKPLVARTDPKSGHLKEASSRQPASVST